MNGLSKRLVSLTMATAMVFSLTAVPATEAKAATASITSKTTSVQADKTYTYKIKASKAKKVKVSVSGTAAKAVRVNGKKATSGITLKGGKTVTVKVKVNPSKTVAGKKFTINYKLDKKKAVKTKSIKVNYSTKGVTLDQTALTMAAGETATLKATMTTVGTNSKIKDWTSSNDAVATVKDGVVTAVAAGTADITVITSNGKTATATVTVEGEKKPEAFTLTASATKADTITATLSREVAADATVTVTKAGLTAAVDGKATITGTTVEFKGTANFTKGNYTVTVKEGELSASADLEVKDEYVAEIKITSTQALTNAENTPDVGDEAGTKAYIYYDVVNQYGESLRNSTTINWTTSAGKPTVDRASGRLTVRNGDGKTPFTYNSEIYVTGVYTKTGASVSTSVKVGLTQALDSVQTVGFINVNAPTTLLDTLPTDFSKTTYRMLYITYDQDGNILPAKDYIAGNEVTFISDAPLLVKSNFTADITYAIDGIEYSSVKIEPGQYVDKGGEVNITAISNKTGTKTVKNYVVGEGGLLQSLTLNTPSKVVANGDQGVTIPYTAKDTKGNTITNYETIVRSTNQLSLTATRGTVTISEANDGTAVIKWSDTDEKKGTYTDSDGVAIPVSITTVVVGGVSDNLMIDLLDTRVPMAIKSINVNSNADALVEGDSYFIDFFGDKDKDQVVYLDQYGEDMKSAVAAQFFDYADDSEYGTVESAYYGIKADFTDANAKFDNSDTYITYATRESGKVSLNANTSKAVVSDTVRYSIVSNKDTAATNSKTWNVAGKIKTVSYTIVPMDKLSSISFGNIGKQQLGTGMAGYANGKTNDTLAGYIKNSVSVTSGNAVKVNTKGGVGVTGSYSGKTLRVPSTYWKVAEDSAFTVNAAKNALDEVSGNSISYSDIYDVNSAQYVRKDATKLLTAYVYKEAGTQDSTTQVAKISTPVVVSDAASEVTTVKFLAGEAFTMNATDTSLSFIINNMTKVKDDHPSNTGLCVQDQYGQEMTVDTNYLLSYSVSESKENTGDFAHVLNSLSASQNGSKNAGLTGAELGDTFTLTATVRDANTSKVVTAVAKITMGSDTNANISNLSVDNDKNLRKNFLGYDR